MRGLLICKECSVGVGILVKGKDGWLHLADCASHGIPPHGVAVKPIADIVCQIRAMGNDVRMVLTGQPREDAFMMRLTEEVTA